MNDLSNLRRPLRIGTRGSPLALWQARHVETLLRQAWPQLTVDGALEIARRSRGTPRIAGRLLRRVRDIAMINSVELVDQSIADQALLSLDVDASGLDAMDRRYLNGMAEHYGGGPVGVETLAAILAEQRDVLEEVIEPYLMQTGLIMRTPRGRCLSHAGWSYIGLTPPKGAQLDLIDTMIAAADDD